MHDLDGDVALEHAIRAAINGRHAAVADALQGFIAVAVDFGHRAARMARRGAGRRVYTGLRDWGRGGLRGAGAYRSEALKQAFCINSLTCECGHRLKLPAVVPAGPEAVGFLRHLKLPAEPNDILRVIAAPTPSSLQALAPA